MRRIIPLEALLWLAGLIFLAVATPTVGEGHFSFCLWRLLGFESCPGCGLGRAISFLLHGDLAASWRAHPLGLPALLLLSTRIMSLIYQAWRRKPATISHQLETHHG